MTKDLHKALAQYFGFDEFRSGQCEVMEHLLAGRSAAAVFPTGAGKSLCYQLPALLLPGITLVVSPLIALMRDQIEALAKRNIAARQLDSSLSLDEYREVMEQLREGRIKLLYVAPERFNNERFREAIRGVEISLFAVDEAHCISEWGHNFRPDYLKLAGYAGDLKAKCVLALTATATDQVLGDIRKGFEIAQKCVVRTGFYRPNLTLLMTPVTSIERDELLLSRLQQRPLGATIIYVSLQKTAETIAAFLINAGLSARAYHAGLKPDIRAAIQDWFMSAADGIVVATIAFGMGVDKSNIRYVYHYNLPKSLENYSQEIGRAGRDDLSSTCEALICRADLAVLENFVYGDTPTFPALRGLVEHLFSQQESMDINLHQLSRTHDIRPLVLRTLLTYLELDGYLRSGTPFFADYQFKPLMSIAQIMAQFEDDQQALLAGIFKQAEKKKIWFHIDLTMAAGRLGTDRARIIRALDDLAEKQMLDVKAAGIRHPYCQIKIPDDPQALAKQLYGRMLKREDAEIARLNNVLELAGSKGCQTNQLAAHFGQDLSQPCGHCSYCLNGQQIISTPIKRQIEEGLLADLKDMGLNDEKAQLLNDPRSLTRFLCGISSPGILRVRLSRHPLFGKLNQHPFKQVQDWVERQYLLDEDEKDVIC